MKTDYVGGKKHPDAIITTYRTFTPGKMLYPAFKTLVMTGAHDCIIIDWGNEKDATDGHDQVVARVKRGEPLSRMAN